MSAKIVAITSASSGIGAATAKRLRDRAIDGVGHVDGWLNNAGRGVNRNVFELTDEEFDAVYETPRKGSRSHGRF